MATLIRWDPFREMASLQNDMSRLINGAFGASNGESRSWIPPLDAWENEDELVYAFDLPGMDERDLSIEFEDGSLTVSGKRERKDEQHLAELNRQLEDNRPASWRDRGLDQGGIQERRARGACAEARAAEAAPDRDRLRRARDHRGQVLAEVVHFERVPGPGPGARLLWPLVDTQERVTQACVRLRVAASRPRMVPRSGTRRRRG